MELSVCFWGLYGGNVSSNNSLPADNFHYLTRKNKTAHAQITFETDFLADTSICDYARDDYQIYASDKDLNSSNWKEDIIAPFTFLYRYEKRAHLPTMFKQKVQIFIKSCFR